MNENMEQNSNVVSMHDKQLRVLKEQFAALESRFAKLLHNAHLNERILDNTHALAVGLLDTAVAGRWADMPDCVVQHLKGNFAVEAVALRLWGVADAYCGLDCAQAVPSDIQQFAASLSAPHCGVNANFAASAWLHGQSAMNEPISSVALLPLRRNVAGETICYGLLVLGSPDTQRFAANKGTALLKNINDLISASLQKLLQN